MLVCVSLCCTLYKLPGTNANCQEVVHKMPIAGKFIRVFKIAEKFSVCTIKCLILPSFKSRTLFICCRVLSRKSR